jgi:hypothetical protein
VVETIQKTREGSVRVLTPVAVMTMLLGQRTPRQRFVLSGESRSYPGPFFTIPS